MELIFSIHYPGKQSQTLVWLFFVLLAKYMQEVDDNPEKMQNSFTERRHSSTPTASSTKAHIKVPYARATNVLAIDIFTQRWETG